MKMIVRQSVNPTMPKTQAAANRHGIGRLWRGDLKRLHAVGQKPVVDTIDGMGYPPQHIVRCHRKRLQGTMQCRVRRHKLVEQKGGVDANLRILLGLWTE
jgi:hypothetical protein